MLTRFHSVLHSLRKEEAYEARFCLLTGLTSMSCWFALIRAKQIAMTLLGE